MKETQYELTIDEHKELKREEAIYAFTGTMFGVGALGLGYGIGVHLTATLHGLETIFVYDLLVASVSLLLLAPLIGHFTQKRMDRTAAYLSVKRKQLEEKERLNAARII